MRIVPPSPEQIEQERLSQEAAAKQLQERLDAERAELEKNGIPFSDIDVDDVVTIVDREKPDEWYRFRVTGVRHARDTSKPGDPEMWMISGPNSSQFTMSMFPSDIYKVVDKRG